MKIIIPLVSVSGLVAVVAIGCADPGKKPATSAAALDVGAVPSAGTNAPHPAATSADALPPEPAGASADPAGAARSVPSGGTYIVQKGDTLFKIAKTQYGDASRWKQIAAANPGINQNAIKVGQKLILP